MSILTHRKKKDMIINTLSRQSVIFPLNTKVEMYEECLRLYF